MSEPVVGIDLGTTNSEIAAWADGCVRIIGRGGHGGQGGQGARLMLPSCVGLSPEGELLIGEAARNQQLLHPDRTVRSIKRRMGSDERVTLGEQRFTPQEISALILRELAGWAGERLGAPVRRAVITVPAYFSDAQRQATREAGELAGLEVVRLVNEPTAASLAYGAAGAEEKTILVYDLGGGTFDVSIVTLAGDVTEVLGSHGNNRLGGDDFDALLVERLLEIVRDESGVDLREAPHRGGLVRLCLAAERAKCRLSDEPFTTVREEAIAEVGGRPVHLEAELARGDYEQMIRPLLESTLDSVARALGDAGKTPGDLDEVLLVGGSTRTPLLFDLLAERLGRAPRQDVHPDLCVALGAGVLASRRAGHDVERVLVDVSPYSFGVSYLDEKDGFPYPYCYRPIIRRNTPLPVTRTEVFFTCYDHQTAVEVEIFQGEHADAMQNTPVGRFMVEGLTEMRGANEVLCRMRLDLDGILEVTAIEKRTNLSRRVTIADATATMSEEDAARARRRLLALYDGRAGAAAGGPEGGDEEPAPEIEVTLDPARRSGGSAAPAGGAGSGEPAAVTVAQAQLVRCRGLLETLADEDRADAIDLNDDVEAAIASGGVEAIERANEALREFLFFVEGV